MPGQRRLAVPDLCGPDRAGVPVPPARAGSFPAKHALALLLAWSAGDVADVGDGEAPDWVREWQQARAQRAAARRDESDTQGETSRRARGSGAPVGHAVPAARSGVAGGLAELDNGSPTRSGVGWPSWSGPGYRQFDQIAARLVDAGAPPVAGDLRRLAGIAGTGEDGRSGCWRNWPCYVC